MSWLVFWLITLHVQFLFYCCFLFFSPPAFLTYHLKDVLYNPWIGLNDVISELNFVWADGNTVSYTNWAPDSPKLYEPILYDSLHPEDGHNRMQVNIAQSLP